MVGSPLDGYKTNPCSMHKELAIASQVPGPSASCASRLTLRSLPEDLDTERNHDTSKSMHLLQEKNPVACSPVDTIQKGIIRDSLPEIGSSSGSSNPSLEKMDLDLAGQELARSMMTFLLPRAVPLLTKTYVKRRSRRKNPQNKSNHCSTSLASKSAEKVESQYPIGMACQGAASSAQQYFRNRWFLQCAHLDSPPPSRLSVAVLWL